MATQKYMNRDTLAATPSAKDPTKTKAQRGGEMGINQSSGTAGRNVTPPPVRQATPDQLRSESWGRENYGANGAAFASSIEPGTQVKQTGIDIDPPGGDEALALIQRHGSVLGGHDPAESWQTKPEDATAFPVSANMKRQQADYSTIGKTALPAKQTDDEAQPARTPK